MTKATVCTLSRKSLLTAPPPSRHTQPASPLMTSSPASASPARSALASCQHSSQRQSSEAVVRSNSGQQQQQQQQQHVQVVLLQFFWQATAGPHAGGKQLKGHAPANTAAVVHPIAWCARSAQRAAEAATDMYCIRPFPVSAAPKALSTHGPQYMWL